MNLNPYKITWVEFFPENGIVTKHDRKAFGDIELSGKLKTFRKHFPTKERAIEFLQSFSKPLDKHYSCKLFTDKQFGMAKEENGYAIPYTTKQNSEIYYL